MSSAVTVSVIIPCYNAAKTLPDSIRSVFVQTEVSSEAIVVDDFSKDDSVSVSTDLAAKHGQVKVLRRAVNGGPAAARNDGLRAANGRYVTFLDADDLHAPGFLATAVQMLDADPLLASVATEVELINCHRPVHPVQMAAIEGSAPSNLVIRRAVAELLGGFPEAPEFRGPTGGEDIAFRIALKQWFRSAKIFKPLLRGRVRQGSHFDLFLDRSRVEDGRLVFTSQVTGEQDKSIAMARERYLERARERIESANLATTTKDHVPTSLATRSAVEYDQWRQRLEGVRGFLHSLEGYALFLQARDGPASGAIVEIGSLFGRSTCWLAAGSRASRRENIVAVDHFRGSPEHQPGGGYPVPELAEGGSTLPVFQANLSAQGLTEQVDLHVGDSITVARDWRGPVRLLFLDGDHSYEATRGDYHAWSRHLVPGAVIGFHDVGVWPGVTQFYDELRARETSLIEIARVRSLRLLRRGLPS
jgi:predicted O-methyltransferase YrrM